MSKKAEVKLNSDAIKELLRSDEIYNSCKEVADNIARSADGNFEVVRRFSAARTWATIRATDEETKQKQLENHPNIYDKVWSGGK